jgi:hypothetical protein
MQRVGVGVGVEDQHRARRVGRRLERVQIAEVQALVAQRRAEAEAREMI